MAQSEHSRPEPARVWAGFAQFDLGCLWKNATESESWKLVAGQLCSDRTGPDDSGMPDFYQGGIS